ncbi:hypothetical protein HW555_001869 [Spodoptera exigua]|uniref:Sperm microtubule inner protein 1 C-terminal domain-containing protein n=1 Tax=Spodoptera exigua TaxID=7107 RepID=A0A835GRB1_SPOEX|nr:hypothetical protein HW555_001869 [Spodoptera exigua]
MPRDEYSNPLLQNFFIERLNQENMKCMKWFLRHKDKIIKNAPNVEDCKHYTTEQIAQAQIEAGLKMFAEQNKVSARFRRKSTLKDEANTTTVNEFFEKREESPIMEPVYPKESSILYKELSAGGGRNAYLNTRYRKLPEEKYTSCVTTSNMYGWKINETELKSSPRKHNRYSIFMHDLFRRSGAYPDPPDSLQPTDAQYSSCLGL